MEHWQGNVVLFNPDLLDFDGHSPFQLPGLATRAPGRSLPMYSGIGNHGKQTELQRFYVVFLIGRLTADNEFPGPRSIGRFHVAHASLTFECLVIPSTPRAFIMILV